MKKNYLSFAISILLLMIVLLRQAQAQDATGSDNIGYDAPVEELSPSLPTPWWVYPVYASPLIFPFAYIILIIRAGRTTPGRIWAREMVYFLGICLGAGMFEFFLRPKGLYIISGTQFFYTALFRPVATLFGILGLTASYLLHRHNQYTIAPRLGAWLTISRTLVLAMVVIYIFTL